jgi:hypothetical protein
VIWDLAQISPPAAADEETVTCQIQSLAHLSIVIVMENADAPARSPKQGSPKSRSSKSPKSPPEIPGDREPGTDASETTASIADSVASTADIEPDFSTDDEGYAASTSTSYLTSIASDIRRGIEENGRLYAAYGMHKPWLPIDDLEVSLSGAFSKERSIPDTATRPIATICSTASSRC